MGLLDLYNSGSTTLNTLTTDLTTQYPSTNTGTPTTTANPGGPVNNFIQIYTDTNTYISVLHNKLSNTLPITNLDVENPGVQGGPNPDITTIYPSLVTGTPTTTQNPGGPLQRFDHSYTPNNTYLDNNTIAGVNSGELSNTLSITNLDIEDPGVDGGIPYNQLKDPTVYPPLVTGTPNNTQNPGGPILKFKHPYNPDNTYLNSNPIEGTDSGKLKDILPITNLDIEDPSVQGGPNKDDVTVYPPLVTGTPTTIQNPGAPPKKFDHPYTLNDTYLELISTGSLVNSLSITNLDIEDPGVNGGIPYNQLKDPTVYPLTSNHTSNIKGWFSSPSTPASKFNQTYYANKTYSSTIGEN